MAVSPSSSMSNSTFGESVFFIKASDLPDILSQAQQISPDRHCYLMQIYFHSLMANSPQTLTSSEMRKLPRIVNNIPIASPGVLHVNPNASPRNEQPPPFPSVSPTTTSPICWRYVTGLSDSCHFFVSEPLSPVEATDSYRGAKQRISDASQLLFGSVPFKCDIILSALHGITVDNILNDIGSHRNGNLHFAH